MARDQKEASSSSLLQPQPVLIVEAHRLLQPSGPRLALGSQGMVAELTATTSPNSVRVRSTPAWVMSSKAPWYLRIRLER